MATEKKTREKLFDRDYSDEQGTGTVSFDGEQIAQVSLANVPEATGKRFILRALMNIAVSRATAAKTAAAEAGEALEAQLEKATATIAETMKEIADGTFSFRGEGEGGLSVEEEQKVIAEYLVETEAFPTVEEALAVLKEVYAKTATQERKQKDNTTKVVELHPDWTELKKDPDIKSALAKAGKGENKAKAVLAKYQKAA